MDQNVEGDSRINVAKTDQKDGDNGTEKESTNNIIPSTGEYKSNEKEQRDDTCILMTKDSTKTVGDMKVINEKREVRDCNNDRSTKESNGNENNDKQTPSSTHNEREGKKNDKSNDTSKSKVDNVINTTTTNEGNVLFVLNLESKGKRSRGMRSSGYLAKARLKDTDGKLPTTIERRKILPLFKKIEEKKGGVGLNGEHGPEMKNDTLKDEKKKDQSIFRQRNWKDHL